MTTSYTITIDCECGDRQTFEDPPFPCIWTCPICKRITFWTSATNSYWEIPQFDKYYDVLNLNTNEFIDKL